MKHIRDTSPRSSRLRGLVASAVAVAIGLTGLVALATTASATQEVCPGTTFTAEAGGWVKTDGLTSTSFTIPQKDGFTVTQVCYKSSTTVVNPAPFTTVVTSTVLNKPAGEPGSNIQNLSHVSVYYTKNVAQQPTSVTPSVAYTPGDCEAAGSAVGSVSEHYTWEDKTIDGALWLIATKVGDVTLTQSEFGPYYVAKKSGAECDVSGGVIIDEGTTTTTTTTTVVRAQTLAETGFGLELLALAGSLSLVGGGLLNGRRVLRARS